jgi:hypothetical protein
MLDIDPWQYERMLDDHARCKLLEAELATLEGANQKLQHNLHAQDMGNRKQVLVQSTLSLVMDALLQDSTGARSKLQSTWAAGSRRPLLDQIQRCMHDRGNRCITWVHGSHGRFISGVSSIAQRLLVIYARMDGGRRLQFPPLVPAAWCRTSNHHEGRHQWLQTSFILMDRPLLCNYEVFADV